MTLLHFARDSEVPNLTAGMRYLQEQVHAHGLRVALSDGCLKDFVRDASEAVVRTQQQGESASSCLCRHLDARVRFILLWTSSDESFERAVWKPLIAIAHRHALPRAWSLAPRPDARREAIAEAAEIPEYPASVRRL